MPPARSSETSSLVVFTYKDRKVACTRPATHEDAVNLAKKTFSALKGIPHERIAISARLPDHREEGVVEIAPAAWQLATNGVKKFTVGVIEEAVNDEEVEEVEQEKAEDGVMMPLSAQSSAQPGRPAAGPSRVPRTRGRGEESFSVFVRSPTGRNDVVGDLYPSDDIYKLKTKFQEISGTPIENQGLIFAWKKLEEGRTLADYSIKSGVTIHFVLQLKGGKPVIYLYPPTSMNAKIQLSLVPQWKLSAVYPQPVKGSFKEGTCSQTAEWDVIAHPCGTMIMEGSSTEVAYIFWEAEAESATGLPDSPPTSRSPSPLGFTQPKAPRARVGFIPGTTRCSPQDSVVMSAQEVPPYLEKALFSLGLHTEARTSFITYWLPSFLKHEHLALRFVPQADFEASAPLEISPKPDVVTRIFMLFEGIPVDQLADWQEARERFLADVNLWKAIDAVNLAKKKFPALKGIPPEMISISALLPDHHEEGVVEIAPEAWQLATNGVKDFTLGIIEEDVKSEEVEEVKKEEEDDVDVMMPGHPQFSAQPPPPTAGPSRASRARGSGEQSFWIIVRTLTGKNDIIDGLYPSDNIYRLKTKIQDVSGPPPDQQRLILAGMELEEGRTLADYSIGRGTTIVVVLKLRGAKPIIYLYPPTSINAKVQLSLVPQWKFSAVYPQPVKGSFKEGKCSQTAEWDVVAHPCGMMTMKGSSTEVAYIFWEAETESATGLPDSPPASRSPSPISTAQPKAPRARTGFIPGTTRCSPQDSVVMSAQEVPPYLEKTLLALGFNTEAKTSFITYWLPSFLKHKHLALRFLPQVDFEASAPLNISPKPDVVTRVFMLFEGIPTDRLADWEEARERSLEDVDLWKAVVGVEDSRKSDDSLFRVLEWGGMEIR